MNLVTFLKRCERPETLFEQSSTVYVRVRNSHSLFFSLIIAHLKRVSTLSTVVLDMSLLEIEAVKAQVSMSFLGMRQTFLCIFHVEQVLDKNLFAAVKNAGPENNLMVIIPEAEELPRTATAYLIEEQIDKQTYEQLSRLVSYESVVRDAAFVQRLFKDTRVIPLDTACLMVAYQGVVGKNTDAFFSTWYHRIEQPEHSLFTLSTVFFTRDAQNFYSLWKILSEQYAPEFWIAYWSEQMWQALVFIAVLQQDGLVAARKAVNRLPFSFMQKDWKLTSSEELTHLHTELYDADWTMKNGGTISGIEVVFAKWF